MDAKTRRAERGSAATSGFAGRSSGTAERPRLAVYRSNRHIYAQLIDDEALARSSRIGLRTARGAGEGGRRQDGAGEGGG